MAKTAEEILMRIEAVAALELTKGFTPEQRANFSNELNTIETFAGYIIELTAKDAAQEIEAYKKRLKAELDNEKSDYDKHLVLFAKNIIDAVK